MLVSKQVEAVLSRDPASRNSDRRLILNVWRDMGLALTKEQEELFYSVPSPESIRRTRQKFQEEGKYLAVKEVAVARKELQKQVREEVVAERLLDEQTLKKLEKKSWF